jgi:hypothetical protein
MAGTSKRLAPGRPGPASLRLAAPLARHGAVVAYRVVAPLFLLLASCAGANDVRDSSGLRHAPSHEVDSQIRGLGAADLRCPLERLDVYVLRSVPPGDLFPKMVFYVASGCGKWAEYECRPREGGSDNCFPAQHAEVHVDPTARK